MTNRFLAPEESRMMRKEADKLIRKMRKPGVVCANCGSDRNIEYHHIVPIFVGGKNIETNIVPLCHSCHKAVTLGTHKNRFMGSTTRKQGRKKKEPQSIYRAALAYYFHMRIGKNELLEMIGETDYRISAKWWFKEYMEREGITEYRNNIDIIRSHGEIKIGQNIGYAVRNGKRTDYFYNGKRLGLNIIREVKE